MSVNIFNEYKVMQSIPNFLANIPNEEFFKERLIYEYDYLKYHVENYCIRVIIILDKCSLLISEVFGLKLNPNKCSCSIILNKYSHNITCKN